MILSDFKAFNPSGKIIGIDWGLRRTGVAISDAAHDFTFTRAPIVLPKNALADALVQAIADLIADEGATGVVIGLPFRTDGGESDTTAMVRAFGEKLAEKIDLPIIFIDETLSSAAAQDEMGRVRRADIKAELDSNAARVILENAIAMMKRR